MLSSIYKNTLVGLYYIHNFCPLQGQYVSLWVPPSIMLGEGKRISRFISIFCFTGNRGRVVLSLNNYTLTKINFVAFVSPSRYPWNAGGMLAWLSNYWVFLSHVNYVSLPDG